MAVYEIDPLQDSRWADLVDTHPDASVFHTQQFLRALRCTYGYRPVVFTTTSKGPLQDGIAFCEVKSWVTGSRLVSLPFADHCQPLLSKSQDMAEIAAHLACTSQSRKWRYVELRPLTSTATCESKWMFQKGAAYCFHSLDLRPTVEQLFKQLHKKAHVQPLQRADREGLVVEEYRSESGVKQLYELLLLTRRRHGLPPQPINWFHNLLACFGDRFMIRVVAKDDQPLACILTLTHKKTAVYKYACSDARFHNLGGMPLLLWQTIKRSREEGLESFDLGRSELDNPGLITFKERLGALRSDLTYYRCPPSAATDELPRWQAAATRKIIQYLPTVCLTAAGKLLYKHVG